MKIVSLFSGCGGLDLGFTNAGFKLVFSNDNDSVTWETFENNHKVEIDKRSITDIPSKDIPDADGIIGGPPCQSWSLAGSMRGLKDPRGQLFYEYLRVIRNKQPKFFLAENVPGIVSSAHKDEFSKLLKKFEKVGYTVSYKVLNANDYGVPQQRKRVFVIGYQKALGKSFEFPIPFEKKPTLKDAIKDLPKSVPAVGKNKPNEKLKILNHEYMTGGFSTIYMSRNRRRTWDEPSFTIQAGGRHAPLHPDSSPMRKIEPDKWEFVGKRPSVRRLSVRECARIQTFPDDFTFRYKRVADGYKLIGNAVAVKMAETIAKKIKKDFTRRV